MLERFIDSLQNAIVRLGNDLLTLVMQYAIVAIVAIVVVIVFALVGMLAS